LIVVREQAHGEALLGAGLGTLLVGRALRGLGMCQVAGQVDYFAADRIGRADDGRGQHGCRRHRQDYRSSSHASSLVLRFRPRSLLAPRNGVNGAGNRVRRVPYRREQHQRDGGLVPTARNQWLQSCSRAWFSSNQRWTAPAGPEESISVESKDPERDFAPP